MLGKLDKTQINNLLCSQIIGRLACTDGENVYILPVSYIYDGDYIYGKTNVGKKLKLLKKNPNVCFEVDQMMDMRNWQSVIVKGKFEELENGNSEKGKAILSEKVFSLLTNSTVHAHEHAVISVLDDCERVKDIVYRIKIEKLSGRFETD